jgi:hypothetical protein
MKITKKLINKVLNFCEKEFGKNLNVFFHKDDFTVYQNGEYIAQIFYSEI